MKNPIKVKLKEGMGKYHIRDEKGRGFRTVGPKEEFFIPERTFESVKDRVIRVVDGSAKVVIEEKKVVEEKKVDPVVEKAEVKAETAVEVKDLPKSTPVSSAPSIPSAPSTPSTEPEASKEESPETEIEPPKASLRMVSAGAGKWNVLNPDGSKLNDILLSEEDARSLLK